MNKIIGERWKSIINYEGLYEISSFGNIKSLYSTKILKLKKNKKFKYLAINLHKNNICKTFYIHRLVLETFIGPCPLGMECRHLDGNPKNNKLENLCWGTRSENRKDAIKHGTFYFCPGYKGSKNPNVKLNNWKVRIIKRLLEDEYLTQIEIAEIFNINPRTISAINKNKLWNYINEQ
jgi:hypothetical protein